MNYIMMFYLSERWSALSNDEKNRIHQDCGAWHDALVRSGHSQSATALQPPSTAKTVRERNGSVLITDGPHIETKEVLGGFEIFACKDLDEALAIAKRFPALRGGAVVEVRPLVGGEGCRET